MLDKHIDLLERRIIKGEKIPEKGFKNFKRYIALGVCAYNLHKIGNELLKQARSEEKTPTKKMAA